MLTIKKELDFNDFQNEYENILYDIDYEAQEIIFDNLEEIFYDGADDMTIRDYIRFQVCISSTSELINDYSILNEDDEDDEDDEEKEELTIEEKNDLVEEYLNENTYLLGSYEDENGENYFIYDEF
jgi:hypothetical protein